MAVSRNCRKNCMSSRLVSKTEYTSIVLIGQRSYWISILLTTDCLGKNMQSAGTQPGHMLASGRRGCKPGKHVCYFGNYLLNSYFINLTILGVSDYKNSDFFSITGFFKWDQIYLCGPYNVSCFLLGNKNTFI